MHEATQYRNNLAKKETQDKFRFKAKWKTMEFSRIFQVTVKI